MEAQLLTAVAAIAGSVAIYLAYKLLRGREHVHPVLAAALELGLQRVSDGRAEGRYKDVDVLVLQTMLGWRVEAALAQPLPGGLTLAPEAVASTLGLRQDLLVGDAWLDHRLAIAADEPEPARAFLLRPAIADRVRLLFRRYAVAHVTPDRLVTEKEGDLKPFRLAGWLDFVAESVAILQGEEEEDEATPA